MQDSYSLLVSLTGSGEFAVSSSQAVLIPAEDR